MSNAGLRLRTLLYVKIAKMLTEIIEKEIAKALESLFPSSGMEGEAVFVEPPKVSGRGDYATNTALVLAKKEGKNALVIAKTLADEMAKNTKLFAKVEAVSPGFVNFFLTKETFIEEISKIGEKYGQTNSLAGKKIIIEYTDPNPFKEFHIGHLMSNAIGEAISRLVEWQGAEVKRACYQGDVGLHVAKAVWSYWRAENKEKEDLIYGKHYALGSRAYGEDEKIKEEIKEINKKLYDKSDSEINAIYEEGKKLSLEYFETIYKKLGTRFDFYFFESESSSFGKQTVEENIEKGIFEKSDGAVVFRGEEEGLHTRVFINSEGLPTYEAKELGLAKIKYDKYSYHQSIVVTGNEVNDYFKVVMKAMEKVFPDLAKKTVHISHGMLRLPSGKMSSRTGEVITAIGLLEGVKVEISEKVKKGEHQLPDRDSVIEQAAIGAIKYSILRQAPGRDVIFDFEKSISLLGDSGPYLQYAHARACSVLRKAQEEKVEASIDLKPEEISNLEKTLVLFPESVSRAASLYAPQYLITYLTLLASSFNAHYAKNIIVDAKSADSPYQVALTEKFVNIMKNGLFILGIAAPEKM